MYRGLVSAEIATTDIAKFFSFLSGTIFAYFANRLWTFKNQNDVAIAASLLRFSVLYGFTLSVNVSANSYFFGCREGEAYQMQYAFLLATCLSALLNFLGMKYFVFNSKTKSNPL